MQIFNKTEHQKFINHFDIKKNPSVIDTKFIEKTKKYLKYIKWIPWLKMIGIGNSISMNTSNKESDIDLFIITSKNRMWLVRIVITFIFSLLWVRKTHKYHAGRFCLSFFCTENGMNFWNFNIQNDIYLYFWIVYFKPILDFDTTYDEFIKTQSWANFEEYKNIIHSNKNYIKYTWNSFWNKCKIFDIFDYLLKKIFLPKTLWHYESLWKPYWVIIHDNMLKFHNNDKRKEIKKELLD